MGSYKSGERRYEIRHFNDLKLAHPQSLAAPAERPKLGRPSRTSVRPEGQTPTDVGDASAPSSFLPSKPVVDDTPSFPELSRETALKNKQAVGTNSNATHETSKQQFHPPTANEEFQGVITGPPPAPAFTRPARSTRNPHPHYVDSFVLDSLYKFP